MQLAGSAEKNRKKMRSETRHICMRRQPKTKTKCVYSLNNNNHWQRIDAVKECHDAHAQRHEVVKPFSKPSNME